MRYRLFLFVLFIPYLIARQAIGEESAGKTPDKFCIDLSENPNSPLPWSDGDLGRIALIFGNDKYSKNVGPLRNPSNDAELISSKLNRFGFSTLCQLNSTKNQMIYSIQNMSDRMKKNSQAVLFYAGHGVSIRGINYIVPIDAEFRTEFELEAQSLNLNSILDELSSTSDSASIVILDACRNEFSIRKTGTRGIYQARGFDTVKQFSGLLIGYSTDPGNVASDGTGQDSPFSMALYENMDTFNESVDSVLARVSDSVSKETGGMQTPWYSASKFAGKVRLRIPRNDIERAMANWNTVKLLSGGSDSCGYIETYLKETAHLAGDPSLSGIISEANSMLLICHEAENSKFPQIGEEKIASPVYISPDRPLVAARLLAYNADYPLKNLELVASDGARIRGQAADTGIIIGMAYHSTPISISLDRNTVTSQDRVWIPVRGPAGNGYVDSKLLSEKNILRSIIVKFEHGSTNISIDSVNLISDFLESLKIESFRNVRIHSLYVNSAAEHSDTGRFMALTRALEVASEVENDGIAKSMISIEYSAGISDIIDEGDDGVTIDIIR
jgi:hypothetical protein